jgi:hypothetical protein
MMVMWRILPLALAAGMSALTAAPAQAADITCDVQCTCVTPKVGSPVGLIVSSGGIVQASTANGLGPAKAGTPLDIGGQLITGPASTAGVVVGTQCSLDIPPNSEMTITEQCGQICVQVTQNAAPPVVAGGGALPLIVLGTGAAIAGGILLLDDDDEGRPASN